MEIQEEFMLLVKHLYKPQAQELHTYNIYKLEKRLEAVVLPVKFMLLLLVFIGLELLHRTY